MPDDPQQQLDALKRSMCGDCGVGPFKGGRRGGGATVSRLVLWGCIGGLALGMVGLVVTLAMDSMTPDSSQLDGRTAADTQSMPRISFHDSERIEVSDAAYRSAGIPDGFTASHRRLDARNIIMHPAGRDDAGVAISHFALAHASVDEAIQSGDTILVNSYTWHYYYMTDSYGQEHFIAILPLSEVAVAATGANLGWQEPEIRAFVEQIELAR